MEVTEADTAIALCTGEVPVLATPRLVILAEEACCRALVGRLEEGTTSVSWRVQLNHSAPAFVGEKVAVEAVLERVAGRRLMFAASARDLSGRMIGAGKLARVVVDVGTFLDHAGG